jgi:hypothetical protein
VYVILWAGTPETTIIMDSCKVKLFKLFARIWIVDLVNLSKGSGSMLRRYASSKTKDMHHQKLNNFCYLNFLQSQ